jgi:hypothetical protein
MTVDTTYQPIQQAFSQALQAFHHNQIEVALQSVSHTLGLMQSVSMPTVARQQPNPCTSSPHEVQEQLTQTLVDLARHNVVAFAFAGALLGWVRDGKLLPNDKDIDIVVPTEFYEAAARVLLSKGWVPASVIVNAVNFRCFMHQRTHLTLDLFAYDSSLPYRVVGGWWPKGLLREQGRLLHFTPFVVAKVNHPLGQHWAIRHPEGVLEQLYGPAWHIPDASFDTTIETPALVSYNDYTHAWATLKLIEAWSSGQAQVFKRRLGAIQRKRPGASELQHWFAQEAA